MGPQSSWSEPSQLRVFYRCRRFWISIRRVRDVPLLPVFIEQLSGQTETYVSQEELGRSHSRHPSTLHLADLNLTADGQEEEEEERASS